MPHPSSPIRILHLEDNYRDAELIRDHLETGGIECSIRCVGTGEEFVEGLSEPLDLCLLDYGIAGYGGQAALKALRERHPDVPVIVVTGVLGEDAAVEWLHLGATDYVLKQRPAKLIPAVRRALAEAEESRKRRIAEQELQQAQTAAKIGTWAFDIAEERFRCSLEVCRIWGLPFGPSLNSEQSLARVHPDDRPMVQQAWASAFKGEKPYELVFRIEVDGYKKFIYARADLVFDSAGRAERVVGVTQDITERERDRHALIASENALRELNTNLETTVRSRTLALETANTQLATKEQEIRSVLNNLLSCVISINADGIIQWANQAVEETLGYSVSEVLGKNVSILMPRLEAGKHDKYLTNYYKTGKAKIIGIGREVQGRHKDGTHIALDLSISEYFVGAERHFTGILRDNSERNRILRDLKTARDDALFASRAKSDFLAVMSHEIRTPMNGVIGMLDVLKLSSLKHEQQDMVKLIHESAHSLLNVINDILDYSKIEAGRMELERVPVDVETVLESVCAMMDRMALSAGVELTYFVDPQLSLSFIGDGARLRQILINLVGNAIKFSGSRTQAGRVHASIGASVPNQESLTIAIADNGIGMDAHTVAALFTPFTQADLSTTRKFGGTGLGLAISQHLVKLMGGEIRVQSKLGVGSVFEIVLPTSAAAATAAPVDGHFLQSTACAIFGSKGSFAESLVFYLSGCGASVHNLGEVNVEKLFALSTRFDLIVCDLESSTDVAKSILDRWRESRRPNIQGLLLVERGRRRSTRRLGDNIVTIDANCLSRRRFLAAAAEACGISSSDEGLNSLSAKRPLPALAIKESELRGGLILVAEDNVINQQVILAQFAALGLRADIANDGRDALACWHRGAYELLFTDIHMPNMDGYQLARAVRASEEGGKHVPIVALTANALKGEADKCREAGMNDYLTKPLPLEMLHAALVRWLPAIESHAATVKVEATDVVPNAAVNVNALLELMGGNKAAAEEILKNFISQSAQSVEALRVAIESGDCGQASEAAHKLKSSSRALGALTLGSLCEEIEVHGRANDAEFLTCILPKFDKALSEVESFIRML